MVEHNVLFKFKADASPEAVQAVVDGLVGLKSQIPGIADLTVGANFCERNQGFTHGLVVRFDDKNTVSGNAATGSCPDGGSTMSGASGITVSVGSQAIGAKAHAARSTVKRDNLWAFISADLP